MRESGNVKAECNAGSINCAAFFLRRKEMVAKTTSHNIYSDVAWTGKKEGFLCLGSAFGKFVTFLFSFFFVFLT